MTEQRLQEMWEAACMLQAHFEQEDYTLDDPTDQTDRLTTLIGAEIDEEDELRELVAEWRNELKEIPPNTDNQRTHRAILQACADELEEVIND